MSTWIFTLGRLALARDRYTAVGGWRRLWWRWWWRVAPLAKKLPAPPPAPKLPRGPTHWSPDGQPLPLCGAPGPAAWTLEYSAATCEACVKRGASIMIQWKANWR